MTFEPDLIEPDGPIPIGENGKETATPSPSVSTTGRVPGPFVATTSNEAVHNEMGGNIISTPSSQGIGLMDLKNIINGLDPGSIEYQEPDAEILALVDAARVDLSKDPPECKMIASVGQSPIATLGNFSCVIGKAKSKKTFFVSLFIGAFLKGSQGVIQTFEAEGKRRVVWFDTEQSRGHFVKAARRAVALGEGGTGYILEVYDLRPLTPAVRQRLIDFVLTKENQRNDIALAVIDGIRDLVTDFNDPEQATNISTWLMQVTDQRGLHVCTVLHQNKSDNNARGHLGTEMINKAETVLSVQKESDTMSSVKAEFCRDREFAPFAFEIDETSGLPRIVDGYVSGSADDAGRGPRRITAATIPESKHRQLMARVFMSQPEYKYTDLVIQTKLIYEGDGLSMGRNKVVEAIQHCRNLGFFQTRQEGKAMFYRLAKPGAPAENLNETEDDE